MRKRERKTKGSIKSLINKKLPKLDEKMRKKINHLMLICCSEKSPKSTWENVEENLMLID